MKIKKGISFSFARLLLSFSLKKSVRECRGVIDKECAHQSVLVVIDAAGSGGAGLEEWGVRVRGGGPGRGCFCLWQHSMIDDDARGRRRGGWGR